MNNSIKVYWIKMEKKAEAICIWLLLLGIITLVVGVIYAIKTNDNEFWLITVALAIISIALGFIAVGMSVKADEILKLIYKDIKILRGQDKIEPSTGDISVQPSPAKLVIETYTPEISVKQKRKEAAQKRLDEDTKRVGYVRGELYQLEDGSWGIAWGGKYPL